MERKTQPLSRRWSGQGILSNDNREVFSTVGVQDLVLEHQVRIFLPSSVEMLKCLLPWIQKAENHFESVCIWP